MTAPLVHWRYLCDEMWHRRRRTALNILGIAFVLALVALLDVLGRGFAEISTLPLRSLSADLIVQRSATESSMPKQMGLMLPYSAQAIKGEELRRLAAEQNVTQAAGFVLLWNFGAGKFFTLSGIPLDPASPSLGPARVRDWLVEGRLPEAGKREVLVERHYGAFYRLKPGTPIKFGLEEFVVSGIINIKQGSQIVASNFYMDIGQARALANLPEDAVNQVFLKVGSINEAEKVKAHIATWLPQASVLSADSMLKLFGGISQVIARFHLWALAGGFVIAFTLIAILVGGTLVERRRDAVILRILGWTRRQTARQFAAEMMMQGLAGGLGAGIILAGAGTLLSRITFEMPGQMPNHDPASFASNAFHASVERVPLPVDITALDWLIPIVAASAFCAILGWWLSLSNSKSLWTSSKNY